ncbi:PH domain-containing protein [uncultured Corynebacterium sp.]|uniref:PH domain-containing protein n=1 Tax=uncultured Corynebacterium sp. TaxID=159447 RepID=UPI0025E39358|nr:PH domain-containing protein [uncultured Corynebacterium sp.]
MNAHTFTPDRTHLLAIGVMVLIALLGISWAPLKLGWILLAPAAMVYWVLRARTTVSEDGIDVRYAFRGGRHIDWDGFAGIGFKGAHAFAATTDGANITLPGVTFNSLPQLAEASRGRIPDALTAGQEAADEKVVVIHRDGHQVLLTKEEYEDYQRTHPSADH